MTDSALEVFQLYANLLTEEARQPWDLIVKEQTESSPFHNIFGVERKKSPGKTSKSFTRQKLEILDFKLPQEAQQCSGASVCAARDAAEQLRGRPPVFVLQPKRKYNDPTGLLLHCRGTCMPYLAHCYPEGVKPLLLILERIEVAHPVDERQPSSKPAKAQGAEQPSKKFALGARIPKKPKQARTEYTCVDKNCELCKKHGGAHTTHNTAECRLYNKDGTPMRGTFGQAARKSHKDSCTKKSYAQVLACMEKLEKSLKKANKKGKKRCRREESDSDSDSS
eukprot:CCRYP_000260-RA/>CCRYP_000260-RA protein AED:0.24 eAED:0.58 QI:0/0/0/1/1/1/3/0/279